MKIGEISAPESQQVPRIEKIHDTFDVRYCSEAPANGDLHSPITSNGYPSEMYKLHSSLDYIPILS